MCIRDRGLDITAAVSANHISLPEKGRKSLLSHVGDGATFLLRNTNTLYRCGMHTHEHKQNIQTTSLPSRKLEEVKAPAASSSHGLLSRLCYRALDFVPLISLDTAENQDGCFGEREVSQIITGNQQYSPYSHLPEPKRILYITCNSTLNLVVIVIVDQ